MFPTWFTSPFAPNPSSLYGSVRSRSSDGSPIGASPLKVNARHMDMLNALMKSTLVKGIEAQLEPAIVAVVQRCIEIYIRHRGVPLNFSAALAQAGFRSDPDVCEKLYSVVLLSI